MKNVTINEFENQVRRLSNNQDIIELIDRIVKSEEGPMIYSADEVLAAVFHGFYYIRPGKDSLQFFNNLFALMKKYSGKTKKMYVAKKRGIPYEAWLWEEISRQAMILAKDLFDADYYEEMRCRLDLYKEYDVTDFRAYVNSLDDGLVEYVFYLLTVFKSDFNALFSDENYRAMWDEIGNECAKVNLDMSDVYYHLDEYAPVIEEHKGLLFHYVGREKMIDIIFKYLDTDSVVLKYMERAVKSIPVEIAHSYTILALGMQELFDINVFDPIITDISKINSMALELNGTKVVKHGSGKYRLSIVSVEEQ